MEGKKRRFWRWRKFLALTNGGQHFFSFSFFLYLQSMILISQLAFNFPLFSFKDLFRKQEQLKYMRNLPFTQSLSFSRLFALFPFTLSLPLLSLSLPPSPLTLLHSLTLSFIFFLPITLSHLHTLSASLSHSPIHSLPFTFIIPIAQKYQTHFSFVAVELWLGTSG